MGITLIHIYEQRDMLRRGEEIARAAKQAEERERLRDHFAAAALTGLLAQGDDGSFSEESYARAAYRWAAAMLRERAVRDSRTADNTNHDAAPAASVQQSTREPERSLLAQSESVERGLPRTGDTPATNPMPKEKLAEVSDGSYRKTDENRGNGDTSRAAPPGECTEPVAWAVIIPLSHGRYAIDDFFVSRSRAVEACDWRKQNTIRGAEIAPLYRHPQPTLTDAERHAVETAALEADAHQHTQRADTLRGLLERFGGER